MKQEKIFAIHMFCKGLISKIYKEFIQLNSKQKKPTSFKKGPKVLIDIFSKEYIQMANRHRKRCFTSIIINEMQTHTNRSYPLTSTKQPSSRRTQINVGKDVEKKKYLNTVGGNVNWCTHYVKHDEGSSKIRLPHDPAIPLLDIYQDKAVN